MDAHSHPYPHSYAHGDRHSHALADSHAISYAHGLAYAHPYSYANGDRHADADGDRNPYPNPRSRAWRSDRSVRQRRQPAPVRLLEGGHRRRAVQSPDNPQDPRLFYDVA